jgi:hypothetical protein
VIARCPARALPTVAVLAALAWHCGIAVDAQAEPTPIEVRVLSQGAKFIGDGTGGARVTLIDVARGIVLASGITRGGTGDTARIMEACGRTPLLHTPDAAVFRGEIELLEPTLVRAEVEGPLGRPHVQARASAERWLLPGLGTGAKGSDGWVLELPGVAVSILEPTAQAVLSITDDNGLDLTVLAEVMMLCGCPVTEGGLWDAAEQRVEVRAHGPAGRRVGPVPLMHTGQPSGFRGSLRLPVEGRWLITLSAWNVRTGATGVHQREVTVTRTAQQQEH